jgi:hypothetical protein
MPNFKVRRQFLQMGLLAFLGGIAGGCGSDSSSESMSPSSEDDPVRTARALRAAEDQMKKNRAAEQKARTRRSHMPFAE